MTSAQMAEPGGLMCNCATIDFTMKWTKMSQINVNWQMLNPEGTLKALNVYQAKVKLL